MGLASPSILPLAWAECSGIVKGILFMLGAQSAPCGEGGDGGYCPFSFDLYGYFIDGKVKM